MRASEEFFNRIRIPVKSLTRSLQLLVDAQLVTLALEGRTLGGDTLALPFSQTKQGYAAPEKSSKSPKVLFSTDFYIPEEFR